MIGVVIIGISVLSYLGNRDWRLLRELPARPRSDRGHRPLDGPDGGADVGAQPGDPPEAEEGEAQQASGGEGTVVAGPWNPTPTPPVSRDQAELDALLDKISATGMDSLTDQERQHLLVLRDRLRRR